MHKTWGWFSSGRQTPQIIESCVLPESGLDRSAGMAFSLPVFAIGRSGAGEYRSITASLTAWPRYVSLPVAAQYLHAASFMTRPPASYYRKYAEGGPVPGGQVPG